MNCSDTNSAALDVGNTLSGKHILLVDDNELNREIALCVLKETGAAITLAATGKEAIDTFAASALQEFDCILMDILMPEMSGSEAAEAIRALDRGDAKTIPIIALSANAAEENETDAKAAGMNGYLTKPIQPQKLADLIAACQQ